LAIWLFCDHIQWLHKAGYILLEPDRVKRIDNTHSKAWFFGLLFGVILCVYKLTKLSQEEKKLRYEISRDSISPPITSLGISIPRNDISESRRRALLLLEDKKMKQVMGVVKNGLDLVIPAARLQWLNISDGTVGIAGSITSVIGIYDTYPSAVTLKVKAT